MDSGELRAPTPLPASGSALLLPDTRLARLPGPGRGARPPGACPRRDPYLGPRGGRGPGPGPVAGAHTGRPLPARRGPRASLPARRGLGLGRCRPRAPAVRLGRARPAAAYPVGRRRRPCLTWTRAGGPGAASGRRAAVARRLMFRSVSVAVAVAAATATAAASSARTTLARGPDTPPARAPIGRRPPRRASHWPALLSRGHRGARLGRILAGAACEELGCRERRGWPRWPRRGPAVAWPTEADGRRRAEGSPPSWAWCVSRPFIPPPPRPPSPICKVGTVSAPGLR